MAPESVRGTTKEEEQTSQAVSEILSRYSKEKKNLIRLLQEIQTKLGYLPREALQRVAQFLEMPDVEVWGVATFYNQFRFVPLGKYHTSVCMGTACHLAGGRLISDALERELEIKVGETSEDGNFSLERVACIGCCMLSPVASGNTALTARRVRWRASEGSRRRRAANAWPSQTRALMVSSPV